ncbi:MAG: glycosyltransferase family 2 protein [Saprospiraceae bacterium]
MATPKLKNKTKVSILIPLFNNMVDGLVRDLLNQCDTIEEDWEIILLEDGSDPAISYTNSQLAQHPKVIWVERKVNQGRAFTRNELAQMASGNYLIFLDADSQLIDPLFIQNYLGHLPTNRIICGGRNYTMNPPPELYYQLHWNYGIKREAKSEEFMSNNFLIPQSLMLTLPFDSHIKFYGHEDTLLGQMIKWKGLDILYIKNPVLHGQLQSAEEFLQKSKQAVQNLWLIKKKYPQFHHPILKITQMTYQLGFSNLIKGMIRIFEGGIKAHLIRSHRPYLWGLDLLKWMWSLEQITSSSLR